MARTHRILPTVILLAIWAAVALAADVRLESRPAPPAGLDGQRILLDAGHGRTWNETTLQWGWQRPILHNEVEDLITPRILNRWLVPYLQNAGAVVFTSRERDEQTHEVRIDDTASTESFEAIGAWQTESLPGAWQNGARTALTQTDTNGPMAVWYADLPKTDRYGLCLWVPALDNPTTATYVVHTSGGDVLLQLNQRANNSQWLWIDWFVFSAGHNPLLTLTTYGEEAGKTVVADGVRLGGGMGDADWGGGVSGLPRWQEYSKSYTRFYGAPDWVWDQTVEQHDYGVRSSFFSWLGGEFALRLHTNSDATGSGTASGTVSPYTYALTDEQAEAIIWGHRRVTQRIKEQWLDTWRDRGDPIPEVNPSYVYPSWLIELAFHDRLDPDLISLTDPDFRSIAARGIYEGLAHIVTGGEAVFLPEPPEDFSVVNLGSGRVRLRWAHPSWGPEPDTYRVYQSADGLGFDLGTDVGNVTETLLEGLTPGEVLYVQVAAENQGGRSFPTETLGVRVGEQPSILIVNGFDRLDQHVQETDNPRRFVREHLEALVAARSGYAIDSASNEAVVKGDVDLGGYALVDWILGKESVDDEVFSSAEQQVVSDYFNAEGRLLISGTDIGFDLYENGTYTDQVFADERLHIELANHAIKEPHVTGAEGTSFEGFTCDVSTTPSQPYDARLADGLGPSPGAYAPVLVWPDQSGAGIAFGTGPGKTLVLSCPLESIVDPADRADLAARAVDFLLAPVDPDNTPPTVESVTLFNVLATEATVSWRASELVIAQIDYGVDTTYGSTVGPTTIYEKRDSLRLADLQPDSTYHFQVRAWDFAGNRNVSPQDYTFTTRALDTTPPAFTSVHVYPSSRSALVRVSTDEEARCEVQYREHPQDPWMSMTSPGYTLNSDFGISNLEPDTWYHYRVRAEDIQHNERYTSESLFLTDPVDQTPPRIDYVRVVAVSDRDAIIAWQTDDPATSQVEWWTETTSPTLSPEDPSLPCAHFYRLDGLTTDTLIHFRVISRNAEGLEARGPEMSLRTLAPIADVIVDNRDPGFSVEGTWATSTMAPERRWGEDYRWKAVKYPGEPPVFATWRGIIPTSGVWQAHCWYVDGPNRSTDTPYYVRFPGGEEVVRVDQMNDAGVFFHPIGQPRYYLAGDAEIAVSNDASTGNVVIADAVMWAFQNLGDPFLYRYLLPQSLINHILDERPLDADLIGDVDVNGDGVVDVADLLRLRMNMAR